MRKNLMIGWLTILLLPFVCVPAGATEMDLNNNQTDDLIMKLAGGVSLEQFIAANNYDPSQVEEGRNGYVLVKDVLTAAIQSSPDVIGVSVMDRDVQAEIMVTVPNDKNYKTDQWYLSRIGMEEVWGDFTGSKEVVVAVLDTGFNYNHEDLQGLMWVNENEIPGNKKDDDKNGFVDDVNGYNFVAKNGVILDDNSHGSAISSVIGANSNNKIGMAGMVWKTTIMPIKVASGSGHASLFDIAQGIYYAVDNGAKVINMSLGTSVDQPVMADAVAYAYEHEVFMAAASGNSKSVGSKTSKPYYPAAYSEVVAVGATTVDDEVANLNNADFISHYGKDLEVVAPGVEIYAATKEDKGYNFYDGTSLASPQVAGLAALLIAKNPTLTVDELRVILHDSAKKVAAMSGDFDQKYGYGLLDVPAALAMVEPENDDVTYGNNYQAALVAKSNDWYLRPGDERTLWVEFRNVGDAKWLIDGDNAVHLGTSSLNDRNSRFYDDASWLSRNRVGSKTVESVKPGEVIRFEFKIMAPAQAGFYREYFSLVAEGLQWLPENQIAWDLTVTNQDVNSSAWVGQSDYLTLAEGITAANWVEFVNNGTTIWKKAGNTAIHLGTSHPVDRTSLFYDMSSWLTNNRIELDEAEVLPGGTGRFLFDIKASKPGVYKEYFQPVVENVTWLPDQGVYWQYTVTK